MGVPNRVLLLPLLLVAQAIYNSEAVGLSAQEINDAHAERASTSRAVVAKVQILLDRARFSPGVIDGRMGENVEQALRAFREANGIAAGDGDAIGSETWKALARDAPEQVIVERTVEDADVRGPFNERIPDGLEAQRNLDWIGYRGPSELLAEKYHMDEEFFGALNAGRALKAGATILVSNLRQDEKIDGIAKLEVVKSIKQLRAYGRDGKLLAAFPATVGSEARPAPAGTLTIEAVAEEPTYTVKPSNNITGVDTTEAFEIAPGPNNPVGIVWIELSKESYGIHGTADPAKIGKTSSHGCVRLTNWDAKTLAYSVAQGIPVHFVER